MEYSRYTIEDIIDKISTGKTPDTTQTLYFDGDILWVTPADMRGQIYINSTEKNISNLALDEKKALLYEKDTVLISSIGEIGNVAIVDKPLASNQQITGVKVKENIILPKFFFYWVKANKKLLSFKANKAIISILNNTNFKKISIQIPNDLDFQKKLIYQLDTIQELIDARIKSIELLDKLIESTYFYMFGDPVNNQKNYPLKKLSEITPKDKIISYGIVQAGPHIEDGVPYIRSGDIKNGNIKIKEPLKTSNKISKSYSRTLCNDGDVIITIRATVGEVAKITSNYVGYNLTRGIAVITPNKRVLLTDYLLSTLLTKGFKYLIERKVKGSTFKEITLQKLREIKIPIPPIELQREFFSLKKSIDLQKENLEKSLEILQSLFQSVLQNAFNQNTEIDEKPIFKELIKRLDVNDLKGNKKRLQYFLELFEENKFDNADDYINAKDKLFGLINAGEIKQNVKEDKIILEMK